MRTDSNSGPLSNTTPETTNLAQSPPDRVILVYSGTSDLAAMLLDAVKKAVGTEECALCQITHSPLGKRNAWQACERRLRIPVEVRHRDQLPAAWGLSCAQLPCVLAQRANEVPRILVSREEIVACGGRIDALEGSVRTALSTRKGTQ